MTNKQKLEHAMMHKYPVRVVWQIGTGHASKQEGVPSEIMLNGFKFKDDVRKHHYVYIVSVEPLEPEVEKARDNAFDHILWRLEYNSHDMGEMGKFVRWEYIVSYVEEAREKFGDVDNVVGTQPEPHESGILGENWSWRDDPEKFGAGILSDANGKPVSIAYYCRETEAMPDAFRALKKIQYWADVIPGKLVEIKLSHKIWKEVLAVLKKAGVE